MATDDTPAVTGSGETLISAIFSLSQKIMRLYSNAVYQETGLNWQDWRILRAVVQLQSCRAQDICEEAGLKKAHVSAGLARLESNGHVARSEHSADGRAKTVCSTAKGQELVRRAHPALATLDEKLTTDVAELDPAVVVSQLESYREKLDSVLVQKDGRED